MIIAQSECILVEMGSIVLDSLRIKSWINSSNQALLEGSGAAVMSGMTITSWMGMRNLLNSFFILFDKR